MYFIVALFVSYLTRIWHSHGYEGEINSPGVYYVHLRSLILKSRHSEGVLVGARRVVVLGLARRRCSPADGGALLHRGRVVVAGAWKGKWKYRTEC